MDPITSGIITSVLANALTALIAEANRNDVSSDAQPPSGFRPLLAAPVARLGRAIAASGAVRDDRLARFPVSDEVEHLIRGLFSTGLVETGDRSTPAMRREFHALHAYMLGDAVPPEQVDALFDALLNACNASLEVAIDQGVLAGVEAKAAVRHRQLSERLAVIEQNTAFLAQGAPPNAQTVQRFVTDYLPQAASRFGYIIPQSFDRQRKVPIDDLFVRPRLASSPDPRRPTANADPVAMTTAIKAISRTVLLGNPGGGKTTFAHKLVHLLTTSPGEPHIAGRRLIPLFVTLRIYAEAKRRDDLSLVQFIAARSNADLQLPVDPATIEYLLRTGRALAIFDGLDELLDTHRRREISADIESFATRFPDAPILVTSREVGYDQAPFDERRFRVWRVAPFEAEQSRAYALKWFATDPDLATTEHEPMASAFLAEAAPTPDLLESPLMLSLLCTLYRGAGSLPRNRPGIYEKCAELMFQRWDQQRGIQVRLDYPSHLFFAMQHLAHWIYTADGHAAGVTETQLIMAATDYLVEYCTDDRIEAEAAAKSFVDFCRGRAWVFSDAGTREDGERLYAFSHRTFLEYFAACYLTRNLPTAAELFQRLLPHILKAEWDVVAQLAVHIKERSHAGSGDEILLGALDAAARSDLPIEERANLYGFAIRCLRFVVPRPAVRRQVAQDFLRF